MTQSEILFNRAQRVIPGGVNSPVRAFLGVGGTPPFMTAGQGAYVIDADGKRYIDYVASWGPLILGHAHPHIVSAVQDVMANGLSFGAPTELEVLLAEKITQLMPAIEMVRMVNSGTEATMSAIRLARAYTKRDMILKFTGCFHGHHDSVLVKAGSGVLTLGIPGSPGVPDALAKLTLTAHYNDLAEVETIFNNYGEQIAAIILEPVVGNSNCLLPLPGFLQGLRQICDRYGSLLIFDEVITGFRVALGGAQAYYNIKPDLTTLGKIIGGGMPVGAYGGKREIMQFIAPIGPVYQSGTLSGNPIAMTAGLTMLNEISQADFYQKLESLTQQLLAGLKTQAFNAGIPFTTNQIGSMFGLFFSEEEKISTFQQATACNVARFKEFFHGMLQRGIYLAPSAFEAGFISAAHGEKEIETTIEAAKQVFATL